jgi:hypothetical protein
MGLREGEGEAVGAFVGPPHADRITSADTDAAFRRMCSFNPNGYFLLSRPSR